MAIESFLPVVLAPIIGSFLGVLIRRLPTGRRVAMTRSRCENCGIVLTWHDLVPLASYLWSRGRCRHCGTPMGGFYPAIELAAISCAAWAVLATPAPDRALADAALGWALLALAWIDFGHMRLPDALTLPLIIGGLAVTWLLEPWALAGHALGASGGYLAFRLLASTYRWWRGHDGLGAGDAKLLAAAGAWVGFEALPMVVLVAALAGIAWILARQAFGRQPDGQARIPFGPFLALGIWLIRLHGDLVLA